MRNVVKWKVKDGIYDLIDLESISAIWMAHYDEFTIIHFQSKYTKSQLEWRFRHSVTNRIVEAGKAFAYVMERFENGPAQEY